MTEKHKVTAEYTQKALDTEKDLEELFDGGLPTMSVMEVEEGGWLVRDWVIQSLIHEAQQLRAIRDAINPPICPGGPKHPSVAQYELTGEP